MNKEITEQREKVVEAARKFVQMYQAKGDFAWIDDLEKEVDTLDNLELEAKTRKELGLVPSLLEEEE